MLQWCDGESQEPQWCERNFHADYDCEKKAGRLRVLVDGLAEGKLVRLRACAENVWGRSSWSKEVQATTFSRPTEDGGGFGPLGAVCGDQAKYRWSQTPTEVIVRVPMGQDVKARDIRFQAHRDRLDVGLAAQGEVAHILRGALPKKVKSDETFWTVEEADRRFGRHLFIQLVKVEPYEKWPCLVEADGHPLIDTGLVRFFSDPGSGLLG